jgi:hypothetical protein
MKLNSYHPWWTFRVKRYVNAGNRFRQIPVEPRGYAIEGFINRGDQVEESGTRKRDELAAQ